MNRIDKEDDMTLFEDEETYGCKAGRIDPIEDITAKEVAFCGFLILSIIISIGAIIIFW